METPKETMNMIILLIIIMMMMNDDERDADDDETCFPAQLLIACNWWPQRCHCHSILPTTL